MKDDMVNCPVCLKPMVKRYTTGTFHRDIFYNCDGCRKNYDGIYLDGYWAGFAAGKSSLNIECSGQAHSPEGAALSQSEITG
jgi:ssDNA-binding Zn-finger/Zn-ribbon topoisomerase 1